MKWYGGSERVRCTGGCEGESRTRERPAANRILLEREAHAAKPRLDVQLLRALLTLLRLLLSKAEE